MQAEQSWNEVKAVPLHAATPSLWQTIVVLFKLRIVALLLLSAFGGAVLGMLATGQTNPLGWLVLTLSGFFSAAGASGINQYLERNRDGKMGRTAKRPLASNQISNPERVLWAGLLMVGGATALALTVNLAMAFWVLLGAIIYVAVYTIWLKPRTVLNIVIGGAAGSCAVLSGGAAMGAWADPAVLLLAGLIFVWTPVHFWALAIAYRQDYAQADYPMLPTQVSPKTAAFWTALHTWLTVACGLAIGLVPQIDWLYLLPIGAASVFLIQRTQELLADPDTKSPAMGLFHASNLYLTAVLVVILFAPLWR